MDNPNLSPNLQKQFALQRQHEKQLLRLSKAKAERAKTQGGGERGAKAKGAK
jgi:hypothetical protein